MRRIRILDLEGEEDLKKVMRRIGVAEAGIEIMARKGKFWKIFIPDVPYPVANIIKQKMLSLGGEAAVSRETVKGGEGTTDCLLLGTEKTIESLMLYLREQPFQLAREIAQGLDEIRKSHSTKEFLIPFPRHPLLIKEKPLIMGILNLTPDSFYDGGKYVGIDSAIKRAEEMLEQGADIIDIGGESTRPGSEPVSVEEELGRVLPIIKELAKRIDVPLSIDTYKSEVARIAISEGVEMVNDISALRFDEKMVEVVRDNRVPVVLMHMKGTPKDMQINPYYEDVIGEIYDFFNERIGWAEQRGVERERIIIDPGIGFGKRLIDNLEILRHLSEFKSLGLPILIGPSRKSFIGAILGGLPPEERLEGTSAAVAIAILKGANIIRVHDVREMKRVAEVAYAIATVSR